MHLLQIQSPHSSFPSFEDDKTHEGIDKVESYEVSDGKERGGKENFPPSPSPSSPSSLSHSSSSLSPSLLMERAMRLYHPFPIFERYVSVDVVHKGEVVVPANTQVCMFVCVCVLCVLLCLSSVCTVQISFSSNPSHISLTR